VLTWIVGGTISGYWGHGQAIEEHAPMMTMNEGDDVGEDRPLDEELGDHGVAFRGGSDGEAPCSGRRAPPSGSGVTCRPERPSGDHDDQPAPCL